MKDICDFNDEAEIECQDSDIEESDMDTEDTILQEMQRLVERSSLTKLPKLPIVAYELKAIRRKLEMW